MNRLPNERGQATVEFALLIPILMMLILVTIQFAVLLQRQVVVVNAAREGARKAAVVADSDVIKKTVLERANLANDQLTIELNRPRSVGSTESVKVIYTDHTDMPFVGGLFPDVHLSASVAMSVEQ